MPSDKISILAINGGSSSLKFALFKVEGTPIQVLKGEIENIGTNNTQFGFTNFITQQKNSVHINAPDHTEAATFLFNWLQTQQDFDSIKAIGHRVVHGMKHTEPEQVTDELMKELKKISFYDPEHLPAEIDLIELFRTNFPALPAIACFDTSFHTSMPMVARLLPVPRRYFEKGIQRYGFHGLSYAFLMQELKKLAGDKAANGKVILAHLGNGASLAAVKDGKSVDTSMGFTPTAGLLMSTRTGDLDPGVAGYLMKTEKLNPEMFNHLVNHESGLLGISETSSDMRELLKTEAIDSRAAEAVEMFCYQSKKWIGSFTAVLGGLDILVFSGGIGEHLAEVRSKICDGLQFLGIELDEVTNSNNETIISRVNSKITVFVIRTNEELMIARLVNNLINK